MGYKVVMSQEEANALIDIAEAYSKIPEHIEHICEMQKKDLRFVLNYLLSAVHSGLISAEEAGEIIYDVYAKEEGNG